MECIRLAHTIQREIFDLSNYDQQASSFFRKVLDYQKSDKKGLKTKTDQSTIKRSVVVSDPEADQTVESKILELLDLFMRDS